MIMRKMMRLWKAALLAVVVSSLGVATAYGLVFNRYYQYYSDSTFTCVVGEVFLNGTHCPDDVGWETGSTTNYRRITTLEDCGTLTGGSSACYQFYGGAWHQMTCP
jgi:hypothetical protein